jgi:hypothetical protein
MVQSGKHHGMRRDHLVHRGDAGARAAGILELTDP